MKLRENVRAVLQYEPFDHMPVIHFGYWQETLEKWREEGHLTAREIENYYDGSPSDRLIARKLGFDYGWQPIVGVNTALFPSFEARIVERRRDPDRFQSRRRADDGKGGDRFHPRGSGTYPG